TRTPTYTPTNTPTHTPTNTPTNTPTWTPTPLPTQTPGGPSATPVPSNTPVPTSTPTNTSTWTPTPLPTQTPGGPSPTPCTLGFSDVHPSDYFYGPVHYLACHGVISGYADGTFRPFANTTRGQMVKIVVLGFQKAIVTPAGGGYTFADVPPSFPF